MLKTLLCALVLGWASMTPMSSVAQDAPRADALSASDGRAVRAVVEAQLKALAADQPAQAFAQAAPAIRSQFGDAKVFMEMVRRNYPMLIKPASVSFFRPEVGEGGVIQAVHFRDRDGQLWRAVYQLQKQADKSWRISGCAVAQDAEASTT